MFTRIKKILRILRLEKELKRQGLEVSYAEKMFLHSQVYNTINTDEDILRNMRFIVHMFK